MAFKLSNPIIILGDSKKNPLKFAVGTVANIASDKMKATNKAKADAREKVNYDKAYAAEMTRMGEDIPTKESSSGVVEEKIESGLAGEESPLAFKLGNNPGPVASRGNISKKHSFGNGEGIKVLREPLADGVRGEAREGTVVVSDDVKPDSPLDKKIQRHEGDHVKRMASEELGFDDNTVTWQGVEYQRKNGKIKYKNKWRKDGWKGFPWEEAATKAE